MQKRTRSRVFDLELRLWLIHWDSILHLLPQLLRGSVPLIVIKNSLLECLIRDEDVVLHEFSLDTLNLFDLIDAISLLPRDYLHIVAHA